MSYSPVRPIAPAIRPGKIWYWIVVLMMLALIGTGVTIGAETLELRVDHGTVCPGP
jgi:Ni,Fe-hydrogenase I cytochrome b subunit